MQYLSVQGEKICTFNLRNDRLLNFIYVENPQIIIIIIEYTGCLK